MDSVENFKQFVKTKPEFSSLVLDGTYNWQQLYEMYTMYGENHEIWNNLNKNKSTVSTIDWMSVIKNIDIDTLISGMQGLEKILDLFAGYLENNQNHLFED